MPLLRPMLQPHDRDVPVLRASDGHPYDDDDHGAGTDQPGLKRT